MRDVAVVGAAMTRFGKYLDRSLKDLTREAVQGALDSAGMDKSVPQVAVVGNAAAGLSTGQECIRAQVVLRDMGIEEIPMINTENACASVMYGPLTRTSIPSRCSSNCSRRWGSRKQKEVRRNRWYSSTTWRTATGAEMIMAPPRLQDTAAWGRSGCSPARRHNLA